MSDPATAPHRRSPKKRTVAFVLGGGGYLGANEVGMLRALLERRIVPDLVLGTSVGAINGAAVARLPQPEAMDVLQSLWTSLDREGVFAASLLTQAANLARTRTHMHSNTRLRSLLARWLPETFQELTVPFQCVAASVERAAERWFDSGALVPAILASSAVPGILPPVEIDGEHYIDGGIVNSIPISRAVSLGATELYVLHVGRVDRPLAPPRNLWQVAWVSFEVARRHRFAHDMANLPKGVTAHVMPTGETQAPRFDSLKQLRYRDFTAAEQRIERAYRASLEYLDRLASAAG